MESLPALFSDLALILVTAGLTTVIFKWLKQPVVLGYIIAGFLIGPNFEWFPVIRDHTSVETWSEIGMVFMLFGIGLEFSFKKLKKVGGTVGITALTELVTMCVVGFLLGKALGWSQMDSIFLGAMLSISSTTIIAKAFDDMKLHREKFSGNVIGELVVEDLEAVLLMVILSTLAVSKSFDGMQLVTSMLKLGFFLLVWFLGGIFLVPTVLRWARKFMSEETLTVFSVGLCFMMVVLANLAGFSSALGAFIMGSILAETLEAEAIHKVTTPIKNLFGAVFFVSVGMMVDPQILVNYWWQILVVTIILLIFKPLSNVLGRLIAGLGLKQAMQGGFCFSQIGEFSFIIATLGLSYGVIDDFLYPIIVSVSIITTFITPYAIKAAIPSYEWVVRSFPKSWVNKLENSDSGIKVRSGKKVNMASFVARQFKNMVIYLAIIIAVVLIGFFIGSFILKYVPRPWGPAISTAVVLVLVSPFLWAMGFKHTLIKTTHKLMEINKFNKTIIRLVFALRFVVVALVAYSVIQHFLNGLFWEKLNVGLPLYHWINVGFALVYTVLLRVLSPAMKFYKRIEERFMDNLNKRQSMQVFTIPEILQENCHLQKMTLSPDSQYSGMFVKDTDFRDNFNVSLVSVERGKQVFELPKADFQLFPFDKITFVGHEDHLRLLLPRVEVFDEQLIQEHEESEVDLYRVEVEQDSPFIGIALMDSGLADKYDAMVIAIERDGHFILNPSARITFQAADLVWFVAQKDKAEYLMHLHAADLKSETLTSI
ncbi:MAG: cation:proton antiporter [Bacteroidales bacterium]|nr:cation:proton antiporter [Bacteroidales bacterium]